MAATSQPPMSLGWLAIGLASLVATLDGTVNVAFPAITTSFQIAPAQIQWIISVFVLTQAGLTIGFGWIADRLGHRIVFLCGLGLSIVALTLCALATTYPALVGFRFLQGLGAALIMACAPALASFLLPGEQRRQAMGYFTMWLGLGLFLGPFMGGWLVQWLDWPGAFWVRVPLAILALLMVWRLSFIGQSAELANAANPASTPHSLNTQLLRNSRFLNLQVASIMINLTTFTLLLLTPFLFIRWPGFSVVTAGLMLSLYPMGTFVAGLMSTRISTEVRSHTLLVAGLFITALSLCIAGLFSATTNTVAMAITMFVIGLGQGLFQSAHFDQTLAAVDPKDRGLAGSIGVVSRLLGIVFSANLMMWIHQSMQQHEPALASDFGQTIAVAGLALLVYSIYFTARLRNTSN